MYAAAISTQRLAGEITLSRTVDINCRQLLAATVPAPITPIEEHVLEGLIARAEREQQRQREHPVGETPATVVSRATALLRDRFAEHWTLGRLAHMLGTNRCTLTTDFRSTLGVGVHQYLVNVRVAVALRRLQTSHDKVETIARDVGFRSRKTLYSASKRVTGKSLRRRHKTADKS